MATTKEMVLKSIQNERKSSIFVNIDVTAQDIASSEPRSNACAASLALDRETARMKLAGRFKFGLCMIYRDDKQLCHIPEDLHKFIQICDYGTEEERAKLKPSKFVIEI